MGSFAQWLVFTVSSAVFFFCAYKCAWHFREANRLRRKIEHACRVLESSREVQERSMSFYELGCMLEKAGEDRAAILVLQKANDLMLIATNELKSSPYYPGLENDENGSCT